MSIPIKSTQPLILSPYHGQRYKLLLNVPNLLAHILFPYDGWLNDSLDVMVDALREDNFVIGFLDTGASMDSLCIVCYSFR